MTTTLQGQPTTPEGQLAAAKKEIEECTANIKHLEKIIANSEGLAGELVESAIANWKKMLAENKKCLKNAQEKIKTLKVLYPSLFNLKGTTAPADKSERPKRGDKKQKQKALGDEVEKQLENLKNLVEKVAEMLQDFIDRHK